ncbi:MAG: homoserine kinase [Alcanivorax sp.]|nr:homoserine kinase [Alcanivorax sp.]
MSVYTPLSHAQLDQTLQRYGFHLDSFQAASHGIENSTFLIDARDGHNQPQPLVLTLFEQLDADQLHPYLALLQRLDQQGLPVPAPLRDRSGQCLLQLAGKPAMLMPRLPGHHEFQVDNGQCQQIGGWLARLHACPTAGLPALPGERQRLTTLAGQLPRLPDTLRPVAHTLLQRWQALPSGDTLIHGDLFRDNVLWQDGAIGALLDFYNACLDRPEYDLAVTLNDWCVDAKGMPLAQAQQALLTGYQQAGGRYQPTLLPLALAVAALRFWLSRLAGPVATDSEGQGSKDPQEFARIFQQRLAALPG